jgi:predicted transcriptional regulator
MAEVAENIHRLPYNSKQMALAIAKYARLVAVLGERGRPPALTPEQIEKAKEMREQGKSISEVAEKLGVAKATVHKHLKETKETPSVRKIFQTGIISERPLAEGATAVSGVKGVAESLKVGVGTAARSLKAEAAIKKYPALDRLEKVSDILQIADFAERWRLPPEKVEEIVDVTVKDGLDAYVAMNFAMIKPEDRKRLLEICAKEGLPPRTAGAAAAVMWGTKGYAVPPEKAVKYALMVKSVEFKVLLPMYDVLKALDKAAREAGVSVETFIALAALRVLREDGYLEESSYESAVEQVKKGFQVKV